MFAVCETKYREYEVTDQNPNCKVVSKEVCFDEVVNGKTKQICRVVPKTECDVQTKNVTKSFPETEVMGQEVSKNHCVQCYSELYSQII